jgi:signal peptidase I
VLFAPPHETPPPYAARHATSSRNERPRRRRLLRKSALLGAKLTVIGALIWGLFFNLSEVRGSSMTPGIHDRDRILVDQMSYVFGGAERGDIVVMRYPLDPSLDYIKRVAGVPGDRVHIERGQVFINGEQVDEPYVSDAALDPYSFYDTTVRDGHYFVLGDNRLRSADSREFGQVPEEYLRGKVRLRLWPLERFGPVH